MASGETNFASLPSKTSPSNADMFLLEDTEDTKKINYSALADAILNKLTSKTYSGLDTSAKNLVSALNELNSNCIKSTVRIQNLNDLFDLSAGVYIHRYTSYDVVNDPNGYSGFVITHVHDGNNGSQWSYNLQGEKWHRIKSSTGIGEWEQD